MSNTVSGIRLLLAHLVCIWELHKRQRLAGLVSCADAHKHVMLLLCWVVVHNHALHRAVVLLDDVDTLANQPMGICRQAKADKQQNR